MKVTLVRFRTRLNYFVAVTLLLGVRPLSAADAAAPSAPAALAGGNPTIFVCGDSTARNTGPGAQGWGTAIEKYFDPAKAAVNNVAHAGTSSLTYFNGDWPKVLPQIKAGDYVLLVFGINDGGLHTPAGLGDETKSVTVKPGQPAVTAHTYGWYMSKMTTDAQAKGAHVYLLTLTVRDIWTNPRATFKDAKPTAALPADYDPAQDKIVRGDNFAKWTKDVGAKLAVPVLDLNNLEGDRYEKLGREKVMVNYLDHNHTNPAGADLLASYIVSGLKAFKAGPFTALLSDKGAALETADAKYVIENDAAAK